MKASKGGGIPADLADLADLAPNEVCGKRWAENPWNRGLADLADLVPASLGISDPHYQELSGSALEGGVVCCTQPLRVAGMRSARSADGREAA